MKEYKVTYFIGVKGTKIRGISKVVTYAENELKAFESIKESEKKSGMGYIPELIKVE